MANAYLSTLVSLALATLLLGSSAKGDEISAEAQGA